MPKLELLNNQAHKDLKVITRQSPELVDKADCALTFPAEFRNVLREYPILFRKDPETGGFCAFAIFGLEPGENLFIQQNSWQASYMPVSVARGPFLIGLQNQQKIGGSAESPVVYVDMDNPRVSDREGEAIFDSDGNMTDYIQQINSYLLAIHQGLDISKNMFATFSEFDLIEPVVLDITLNNGQKIQLKGNYTVHEEKLAALKGDALEKLHQSGFLQAAYLIVASLNNIERLIAMKNSR